MDKYGRVNRFPEFKIGASYTWHQRQATRGPFRLLEVNRIAGFVVMEDGNGERHRFYDALFRFKAVAQSGTRSLEATAHSCP